MRALQHSHSRSHTAEVPSRAARRTVLGPADVRLGSRLLAARLLSGRSAQVLSHRAAGAGQVHAFSGQAAVNTLVPNAAQAFRKNDVVHGIIG